MKISIKYLIFFGLAFLTLVIFEWNKPKPVNWSETYSRNDKIPFGNYILYELLTDIFPGQEISPVQHTIYETNNYTGTSRFNYLFINKEFSPDAGDTEALLGMVKSGNNVFIAAENILGALRDSLKITLSDSILSGKDPILTQRFVNPYLYDTEDFNFMRSSYIHYFTDFDSLNTKIVAVDNFNNATLIKINYGEGAFLISSFPIAFTNFNMLYKNNSKFVSTAFSYMNNAPVYWDEYYKTGRAEIKTPLRFILSKESLSFAYFITIFSLCLFIIFEARRRQRVIPIITPLVNASLEFIETLGRLYYQHNDHKDLAHKIILYFMEDIRSRYYIKTDMSYDVFVNTLTEKSGVKKEKVDDLIRFINDIKRKQHVNDHHLQTLNSKIEEFKKSCI